MSFRVRKSQSLARNLRRLLKSQTGKAIRHLEAYLLDPENSVHEARIAFKRIRTLLLLLKHSLKQPAYRHWNHAFRNLGIELSYQRDRQVKQQAINEIGTDDRDLNLDLSDLVTAEDELSVEQVLDSLYALRKELAQLTTRQTGFKLIRKTSLRIYQDGRAAMHQARDSNKDEDFHEWRKKAKHLYHLISILQPINKRELKPLRKDLYTLTQLLGDDHDLSLLKSDAMRRHDYPLINRIEAEQTALRDESMTYGARLYRSSGEEFIEQLETFWKAFRHSH